VKKLIAMLLLAGVVLTGAIGCGGSTGTGAAKKTEPPAGQTKTP
jgi:hypothetical protein